MRAVSVSADRQLVDQIIDVPTPDGHDVLVKIRAISINPIDLKRIYRIGANDPRILGYDALGEIVAVGADVTKYHLGDVIFYAGSTTRNGSYADYQLVDERITALAPTRVAAVKAAVMPLTWLTAYEILIDKLGYVPFRQGNSGTILVINGAGGAGSVLTQLAKWLGLTVLATSSPANFDWLRQHGTTVPLDYHGDLVAAVHEAGVEMVDHVINLFDTAAYFETAIALLRPFGHVVNVAQTTVPLDFVKLQAKALSFDWELMFTKPAFGYQQTSQGEALALLAQLLDDGEIVSTLTTQLTGSMTVEQIQAAYNQLKTNQVVGKIGLELID